MDSLLSLITIPRVYSFSEKHFVYEGEPLKLNVMCIPFCQNCLVRHANTDEVCIKDTSFLYSYTFTPSYKDTVILVKVDSNIVDTIFVHVFPRNKRLTFDEKVLIDYINANTYAIRGDILSRARDSTLFYFIFLFLLIFTWFYEKRREKKE